MRLLLLLLITLPFNNYSHDLEKVTQLVDRDSYVIGNKVLVVGKLMEYKKPDRFIVLKCNESLKIEKQVELEIEGYKIIKGNKHENGIKLLISKGNEGELVDIGVDDLQISRSKSAINQKIANKSNYSKSSREFAGDFYYSCANQNAYSNNLLIVNIISGEQTKMKVPKIEGGSSKYWEYHTISDNVVIISSGMEANGVGGIGYHVLEKGAITSSKFISLGNNITADYGCTFQLNDKNEIIITGGYKSSNRSQNHDGVFYVNVEKEVIKVIPTSELSCSNHESFRKKSKFRSRGLTYFQDGTYIIFDNNFLQSNGDVSARIFPLTIVIRLNEKYDTQWSQYHESRGKRWGENLNLDGNKKIGSIINVSNAGIEIAFFGETDINVALINPAGDISKRIDQISDIQSMSINASAQVLESLNGRRYNYAKD